MEAILGFIQTHKLYFEAAQALTSVVNLFAWCLAAFLLVLALRKNRIEFLSLGPFSFRMREEAIDATATAAQAWQAEVGGSKVDIPRVRATVERAFMPTTLENLTGKAILWVDDNP